MSSLAEGRGLKRYEYINALRGYAVMAVVATHTPILAPELPLIVKRYADFGGYGVSLFFIVSALTLSLSWHSRDEKSAGAFYVRRFFRIAPAFWLAIVFYSYFPWVNRDYWAPSGVSGTSIGLTVLFLHGWHPETINSVVPGGWSIAVEWGFYLIFPLLITWIRSFQIAMFVCLISLAVAKLIDPIVFPFLVRCFSETPQYLVSLFENLWLPSSLFIFIAGIACWFSIISMRVSRLVADAEVTFVVPLIALMPFLSSVLIDIFTPFVFALLVHALACGGGKFLINSVVQRIGVVSFSIYLWHFAVIMLIKSAGVSLKGWHGADYLLFYAAVLAITYAVSEVTYRTIERPMIETGNSIIRQWRELHAAL